MSPIQPFKSVRIGVYEVNVWRAGMAEPQVGDVIERDGGKVRVTRTDRREVGMADLRVFDSARPDLGDYILILEYEYLDPA